MTSNSLHYDGVAYKNVYHLAKICKGMNEREVISIMRKPYRYESFEICEDVYDVWFYVTQTTILDQTRMVPRNLTPLTFKNGILVGTGYDYYYYVTKESANQIDEIQDEKQKTDRLEDIPIEKALESPKNKTAASLEKSTDSHLEPQQEKKKVIQTASFIMPHKAKLGAREPPLSSKVKMGMNKTKVSRIIGSPSDTESYQVGKNTYDVWFYYSKNSDEMLPLTFKNDVLVGTTSEYYEEMKEASAHSGIGDYTRGDEQMQQEESDQNFNYW